MLVIKNGQIMQNGKLVKKHILIDGKKIKKLSNVIPKSKNYIDAKDKIILPGLIDCHVHMREPGYENKEDFFSGSKAAAAGGITTFIDMPNSNPPTTSIEILNKKRELAKKSLVNFGFHFGTLGDNIEQIKEAEKNNIASVKVFMDETTGRMIVSDEKLLKQIFSNSTFVSVHAEGQNMEKAIDFAKSSKSKLYVCHVSLKSEIDYLLKHKPKDVFAEVTPHHLFLTEKDKNQYNIMKPMLKTEEDRKSLWQGIEKGVINTIATDHAPHTVTEKEFETVYGVPGLETMLPLLLDAVNKKKITLEKVIKLTSENPAKIFKIKDKGKIEAGYDADLVIVDMDFEKEVENNKLFTKCGWSPFVGWKLKGWPIITLVGGQIVFENNQINHIMGEEVKFG